MGGSRSGAQGLPPCSQLCAQHVLREKATRGLLALGTSRRASALLWRGRLFRFLQDHSSLLYEHVNELGELPGGAMPGMVCVNRPRAHTCCAVSTASQRAGQGAPLGTMSSVRWACAVGCAVLGPTPTDHACPGVSGPAPARCSPLWLLLSPVSPWWGSQGLQGLT